MISEIQTITRILASISSLETDTGAKDSDAAEYYMTQYIYPVRDVFNEAKEFCIDAALIGQVKDKLNLTDIGKAYLDLGDKRDKAFILEANPKQKDFLSRKVFLAPGILDLVKKILYHFHMGQNGELLLPREEMARLKDQNLLNLLLQLEIFIEKKDFIQLAPQYAQLLAVVVSDTVMVITPETFEKSEAYKKELAEIAERYVLQNESSRLLGVGATKQSKQIDHVALRNVAAGYDIASFDDADSQNHDRFIEVKAGRHTPIRFFFSKNEFEIAKRLKESYYIYYVCMKDKKPTELYIFQNPTEGIMKDLKFATQTDTYEIEEIQKTFK